MNFKYERLPVFCHYCGFLGHDLRYFAKYFSITKTGIEVDCGYGDWLKASGKAHSPLKQGFVKEGSNDGDNGMMKGPSGSQSTSEVYENGGGKDSFPNKTAMESSGGATGLMGVEFVGHEDRAENHGLGEVDKENRVSCSIDLGVHNSSLDVGTDLVPVIYKKYVYCTEEGARLSSNKKKNTWTRLARMDVGPVEILKEGAKSILGKRNMFEVFSIGETEDEKCKGKRGKVNDELNMNEVAGELNHPCREQ